MLRSAKANFSAGTRVRLKSPGPVPEWSVWDPCQRTSTSVKRRLQQLFFKGDNRVQAEVAYIANESARDRLRSQGRIKVELRDAAGSTVTVLADADSIAPA